MKDKSAFETMFQLSSETDSSRSDMSATQSTEGDADERMDWIETEGSECDNGGLVVDKEVLSAAGGGERRAAVPFDT